MQRQRIEPLAAIPLAPTVAALPKADIHVHQEWSPRLDRVLARRAGLASYDWRAWATRLMTDVAPGLPRLDQLAKTLPAPAEADAENENFTARLEDLLEEGAAEGAVLIEMRFGGATALQHPDFMVLFREAERRVRARHPMVRAEAIYTLLTYDEPERLERVIAECLHAATDGLTGIDLLYEPYGTEADWTPIYRLAARAADAGLGVSVHAGEFSTANIAAAVRVPGVTRLGHAVYAAEDPWLLELLAARGITVECPLTCNVVLGAVPSYEEHPIRRFVASGIPVALCTDDPVQLSTTIGREYAIAAALGFTPAELLAFSANAIRACFASPERKRELLDVLREWERGSATHDGALACSAK